MRVPRDAGAPANLSFRHEAGYTEEQIRDMALPCGRRFLVLRRAANLVGIRPAHIGTLFGVAVIARSGEVIDARLGVHPNDRGAAETMRLRVGF